MGKDDLGPLPFKAMETSVCLKRQLPFYVAAFEPTCDERSAHAELCLPSCWVARSQQQLKAHLSPGGASLLSPRFLAKCSRDPGGHEDAWSPSEERCVCWGHGGESELLQIFLHPRGRAARRCGQDFQASSDTSGSHWSCLLGKHHFAANLKLPDVCILLAFCHIISPPFLVTAVPFYLASSLCVSLTSIALFASGSPPPPRFSSLL